MSLPLISLSRIYFSLIFKENLINYKNNAPFITENSRICHVVIWKVIVKDFNEVINLPVILI